MGDKRIGHVLFTGNDPPVSASELNELEEQYGIRLPVDYKDFIVSINGGSPRPSGFCMLDESPGQLGAGTASLVEVLENELDASDSTSRRQELKEDINFLKNSYIPQRVDRLYGFYSIPPSLHWRFELMVGSPGEWTLRLLPIGEDSDGTPILMSLNENDFGSIYCMAIDGSEPSESSGLKQFRVGRSFSDFIQRLFPARILYAAGMTPPPRHRLIFRIDEYDE
ncbi:MAG TPA: hypothetical protein DDZ51_06550 [Planctomycetaceae bacterium]|nr:hypothetical protein [Planctomycetaceae bacterium]